MFDLYSRTVWLVLPFKVLILTLTCGGGLVAYAKYHDCDPIVTKQVRAPDQIYPLFVLDSLSFIPGFTGLFVAGVFSGSLRFVVYKLNLNYPSPSINCLLSVL